MRSEASWSPCRSRLARIASTSTIRPDSSRRASCERDAGRAGRPRAARPTRPSSRARRVRGRPTMPSASTPALARTSRASGVQVLAALGVALVRHGDAADVPRCRRLAQLADLGSLQLVDLVADARQRAADHRRARRRTPRGGPARSARRCPGSRQAQLGAELRAQRQAVRARRSPSTPTAPPSWPTSHRGPALAQPVQVAAYLVGPGRDLEAEGDRRARLTVGPAGHHACRGAPRPASSSDVLDRPQIAPDQRADRRA